jgi:hypothetical protein
MWSVPTFAGKVRSVSLAEPTGRRNRPVSGWSLPLTKEDDVDKNVFRSMRRAAPRCQHRRKPTLTTPEAPQRRLDCESTQAMTSPLSQAPSSRGSSCNPSRLAPKLSPDGRRLALARPVQEVMDMWVAAVQCRRAANLAGPRPLRLGSPVGAQHQAFPPVSRRAYQRRPPGGPRLLWMAFADRG